MENGDGEGEGEVEKKEGFLDRWSMVTIDSANLHKFNRERENIHRFPCQIHQSCLPPVPKL